MKEATTGQDQLSSKPQKQLKIASIDESGGKVLIRVSGYKEGGKVGVFINGIESGRAVINEETILVRLRSALSDTFSLTVKTVK